jgi:hypothetical protein
MKNIVLIALVLVTWIRSLAQTGQISGRVVDLKTHLPVPFANVYINKSTMGTVTNDSGRFILPGIPMGTNEIVFSSIGYVHCQLMVITKQSDNKPLLVQLSPDVQQLSEVEIKSTRDKVWEAQVRRFEKIFLGITTKCNILNPWVINITNEKNVMVASALLPLEIENKALGYKLFFQLKDFQFSRSGFAIVGNVRFEEIKTSNAVEALEWTKNRERAYRGSVRHLMKSILDHRITQDGFSLYKEKVKERLRTIAPSTVYDSNVEPYDTSSLVSRGNSVNEYFIHLTNKVEVHFDQNAAGSNYYTNPNSWLEVKGGRVLVNKEGTILNPADVAISGRMAEARVSSMLPADYKPQNVVVIQLPKVFSAKRLQEKVYVHTDRPYYYPGDKIWLSAFMNYRSASLMDTLSKVLYVDLINSDRITTQTLILKIDNGRASGAFSIPEKIAPGKYVLRAYTQWMRNYGISQFFYKPVNILSLYDGVDAVPKTPTSDNLLKITLDKPLYQKRAKVKITVALDSVNQEEKLYGTFSISVIDNAITIPVTEPVSIKNDFDLSEPSQEMLSTFKYPIERGITMAGIYKGQNGKGKKTNLTVLSEDLKDIYMVPTLEHGEFLLRDLVIYDSTKFGYQPKEGRVQLNPRDEPALPEILPTFNLPLAPLTTSYKVSPHDTLKSIMLKEVEVKDRKIKNFENSYAEPGYNFKSESIETYQNVAAAIAAKIPGYVLYFDGFSWFLIRARSASTNFGTRPQEPALFIENALVVGETTGDRLVALNPAAIDHVEVKGMIGSNMGANGSSGFISVYLKKYIEPPFKGLPIVKLRGFDRIKSFQSPNYDYVPVNTGFDDIRPTLYWNPNLNLSPTHAIANITFYTSDQSGTYRVIIEGVTNKGTVHAEAVVQVE